MVCVGLLTRIRISGAATFGVSVVDAGASGLAGVGLVSASCDWGWGCVCVSVPGVPVLGVCESEPVWALAGDSETGAAVLGVCDSEPVWALAGKASIAPTAATVNKRQ